MVVSHVMSKRMSQQFLVEWLKFRLLVKFTYVLIGYRDKFFGVLTSVVRCVADSYES